MIYRWLQDSGLFQIAQAICLLWGERSGGVHPQEILENSEFQMHFPALRGANLCI